MNELKQLQDIQDEMREGYAPEKTAPDYGEPWKNMAMLACAGMAYPVAEIARLRLMQWIPLTVAQPSEEDGDDCEDVDWCVGNDIWTGNYKDSSLGNRKATHWRRIVLP